MTQPANHTNNTNPQDPDGPKSRQAATTPRPELVDPDGPEYPRPESGGCNILGLRQTVYGICAATVLICLAIAILIMALAGHH